MAVTLPPTPTAMFVWAPRRLFCPSPEKRTMAPSGTAPRTGSTTLPTRPLMEGNCFGDRGAKRVSVGAAKQLKCV
jgi:hypothetical protein